MFRINLFKTESRRSKGRNIEKNHPWNILNVHDFRGASNCKIQEGLLSRKDSCVVRSTLVGKREKVPTENFNMSFFKRLGLVDNTSSSVFIYLCSFRSA